MRGDKTLFPATDYSKLKTVLPSSARPRLARWPTWLAVLAALALYWWMAVSVSPRMGVTADEAMHLSGGYSYWTLHDYRLHPENGVLPMRIATLPWLAMDLKFPPLNRDEWRHANVNRLGHELLFGLGNPTDVMMQRARMMIALVGAFTVWLTWRWADRLFGRKAGWIALGLATFCPALLAHGGLATSDMTLTACVLAALTMVWRVLHRATVGRVIVTAVACGLAFLAKMSGVIIIPLFAILLGLRWLRAVPYPIVLGSSPVWLRRRGQIVGATLGVTLAVAAGSVAVVWAGYGFRFSGFSPAQSAGAHYLFDWDVVLDRKALPVANDTTVPELGRYAPPMRASAVAETIAWVRDRNLLPESYLWGFALTYKFSRARPAYFLGEYRTTGWRSFFPVAFVLKTPLAALLLIAMGTATLLSVAGKQRGDNGRWQKPWVYRAAPLLVFFVAYWALAIQMHLNIGHRHILPTYPVFYIIAAGAGILLATPWRRGTLVLFCALLAWHATDSLRTRPFYLSYFQPLFGGIPKGWHYLVDSSYDWGQGLPDLVRWQREHDAAHDPAPLFLSYFGVDSPRARRLHVTRFGDEVSDSGPRTFPAQLRAGWYAISATQLRRVYLPTRGPWTSEHERAYRAVQARLVAASQGGEIPPNELLQLARDYEMLQFGRLAYFLEAREPVEVVGGSLLLYRLSDAEVSFALNAPLDALNARRTGHSAH